MTHIRGSVHLRRRLAGCGLATVVGLAATWLSLAGGAGLAHAAPAADVTPGQSIQLALNGAANGDTLRIHAGVYTESLTLNKPVSLTAFGDGLVTLVALAGQRVLTITGAAVTSATVVSELTFTGGHVTGSGGGILVSSGAQPRLLNLIITSNTASVNGGGIAAQTPSSLVLVNARVTSNTATSSGGGAWTNSGATLSGGSFQHNTAVTGSGGGLMVFGGGLALTGTEFFSNTTLVGDGGGLYHFGGASAHLEQASLTANFSAHSGGAAYFEGPLTVDDADVFNNTATVDGGGLYVLGPALVSGGLFLDNQATIISSRGGGLAALSSLTITGTQFVNNNAQRPSGVPGRVCETNSTFSCSESSEKIRASPDLGRSAIAPEAIRKI